MTPEPAPAEPAVHPGGATVAAPADAPRDVVVIGAGPAGLTAAYELGKRGATATVLEAGTVVGGISQTVVRDGWRFDIGGHRFFTKVQSVTDLWHEILPDGDFLRRPRMSRIYYDGKFFDYPLKASNALRNLGIFEAVRCVLSYAWARVRPPEDQSHFEGWVAARFGWRLYGIFFKTYTEKVWGVAATEIQADWAAQRIKNLSLGKAIANALLPTGRGEHVTSLIEEFDYPRHGPGMMWERCAELVRDQGSEIHFDARVRRVLTGPSGAVAVVTETGGVEQEHPVGHLISSMPIATLVQACDPPAPESVLAAARGLSHRDYLTVALVVPEEHGFPDNWIYVHDGAVRLGRIQNYGSWSPEMVKPGKTCLGLEYFVFEGDDLWELPDDELIAFGIGELASLGLVPDGVVEAGYVVRVPKAYPTYDAGYDQRVDVLRRWMAEALPNVHPVGRNGMHRYNNQDHSMVTAALTVENLFGADHDVWAVNVEEEYHEEATTSSRPSGGRDAPVLPRKPTGAR